MLSNKRKRPSKTERSDAKMLLSSAQYYYIYKLLQLEVMRHIKCIPKVPNHIRAIILRSHDGEHTQTAYKSCANKKTLPDSKNNNK